MTRARILKLRAFLCLSLIALTATKGSSTTLVELLRSDVGIRAISEQLKLQQNLRPKEVSDQIVGEENGALFRRIELNFDVLGRTRVFVRQPKNFARPLPLIFVMGGARSGGEILKMFPAGGNFVIAVYDYNIANETRTYRVAAEMARQLPFLQGRAAASLAWLSHNPMIAADRINVVMVSFGTFVGPLALRMASPLMDSPIYANVFAFGGAEVERLVLPRFEQVLAKDDFAQVEKPVRMVLDLIEPKYHVPNLTGRFLVINGQKDEIIPKASTAALEAAIRGPKTVIDMPVPHINTDQTKTIESTISEIEIWLGEQGALK